jgi:hypothetical protein
MADVSLDQRIMEKLRQLDEAAKQRVLHFIEQAAEQREADWEEQVVIESLGEALRPDGSIDFEMLRASGAAMTLEDLYPEGEEDGGA